MNLILSFLIGVGSWIFSRYFFFGVSAVIVRVFSYAFIFMSFSSMPGSSARTVRWSSSSKMSTSGCLSFVKLGM